MAKRRIIKAKAAQSMPCTVSSRKRIIRAVASSTAIETGEPIEKIESRLETRRTGTRKVKLA